MRIIISALLTLAVVSCSKQSSEEYLLAAKQHVEQQNYQAASIELKNAIKQSPTLAEARFLLGKIHLQTKQYQSAEKELNKALELKYPANEVLPLLSEAYQKTQSDVALLDLPHNETGMSAESAAQIGLYKIQALLRLEQNDKAEQIINEVQQLDTDSVYKSLALAYSLLINNQLEAAEQQLDAILSTHNQQEDTLKLKALLLARQGKIEESADVYLRYLSFYPDDLEISFVSARLLVEINRTKEAEPLIDKLLAINEDNGLLNQLKGITRFNAKDSKNALLYTEKSIVSSPADPALRLLAGYSAYQQEAYETAQKHLSIIAQDLPSEHDALRILAASQLRLGLNKEAGETIAGLEGLSEKDNALVSSVGLALVKSGEVAQARKILTKSNDLNAETAEDLTRLGLLKLSLNDVEGITNLESALDKEPEQKVTRNTLATAYLSTKQFDKAHQLAKRWKQDDSDDIRAFQLAAVTYTQQGQVVKAKQEYQQILTIQPSHLGAQLALVDIAINEKDLDTANKGIDAMLAQKADYAPALVKLYTLAAQQGDTSNAVAVITQQFNQNQESRNLRLLLAKVYLQEKQPEKTVEMLSNFAIDEAPKVYWQTLGQAYFRLKQVDAMKKHYSDWLTQSPNDRDAVMSNLILLDNQRSYDEALVLSNEYLKNHTSDLEVQLLNTHFQLINGKVKLAKDNLALLPERANELPFTKGLIGQIQMTENNFSEALPNLLAAYGEQDSARNARLIYINYTKIAEPEKGYQFLQEHVKNNPNDVVTIMQLAELQVVSNTDEAIKNYEHVIKFSGKNFIAHNNLAYFYLQRSQLDKALSHAEKALSIRPDMPDVLDTIGRVYLAKKDYKSGVSYLSKAVRDNNVNDEIYLNYIEALLLNNEKTLAKRKIEQRKFTQAQSISRVESMKKQFAI